jgi:cytochrome bd-type quinol oxidase subunit 2
MLLHQESGGKFSILDFDTIVKLAIPLVVAFLGLIYFLSKLLSDSSELEHKREYVSNVMLQKLGPSMQVVNRSYSILENKSENDEPQDGPPGGLVENPLGQFESQSLRLSAELERWSQWKKGLEHCENQIMWGIYLSIIGIIILVCSLLAGVFGNEYLYLNMLSALLAISSIGIALIALYPIYTHSNLVRDTNRTWRRIRDEQWGNQI